MRRVTMVLWCTGAAAGLSGCRHRQAIPSLLASAQILTAPASPPPLIWPAMKGPLPEGIVNAPAVIVSEAKPKRAPKKTAPKTAPVEEAAGGEPMPDTAAIGELSAGGAATVQTQQTATELIVEGEKRLDALSKEIAKQQAAQIRKVRYFLRQAQQALKTGDADGARTLATKAMLLLDDLTK